MYSLNFMRKIHSSKLLFCFHSFDNPVFCNKGRSVKTWLSFVCTSVSARDNSDDGSETVSIADKSSTRVALASIFASVGKAVMILVPSSGADVVWNYQFYFLYVFSFVLPF